MQHIAPYSLEEPPKPSIYLTKKVLLKSCFTTKPYFLSVDYPILRIFQEKFSHEIKPTKFSAKLKVGIE